MFLRYKVVLTLPLLVLSARGAEEDPASATITLKKGDKIVFFGDSLTALAIKDRNVPEGKGYVPLVREALKEKGVEVDAVATGGHKVTDLLKRVDRDVIARKPTVVVIQIGVNDAGAGVTAAQFKGQPGAFVDRLREGRAQVIRGTC